MTPYKANESKDYSILYNNAVRPVMFQGWCCTYTYKTPEWSHRFTEMGNLGP